MEARAQGTIFGVGQPMCRDMYLSFANRDDAARQLAQALAVYRGQHPLVLAIPRGGVPMGRIVADALGGEVDVVLVRKLGAPGNPEYAIGAVDEHGKITLNESAGWLDVEDRYVELEARRQLELIRERSSRYRAGRPPTPVEGRTVIVVDDGLATGATMLSALKSVRALHPQHLVCAVPVAAPESLEEVEPYADRVVCLATPSPFHAVGLYYQDFASVTDQEVMAALHPAGGSVGTVHIPADGVRLEGELHLPPSPLGLVIFVHGSGSSRHSPRNRWVADVLQGQGIGTLLFDLLTPFEDATPRARFDIPLLSQRLEAVLAWARNEPTCRHLPIGLFGASTGAAAALTVAAAHPDGIAGVVSRGGRPDLAGQPALAGVKVPTLLIVGGNDPQVLELNQAALALMKPYGELLVVPGASHLFEESGTLEQAATAAATWFRAVFGKRSAGTPDST